MFPAEQPYVPILQNQRNLTTLFHSILFSVSFKLTVSPLVLSLLFSWLTLKWLINSMSHTHDVFMKWFFSHTLSVLFRTSSPHFFFLFFFFLSYRQTENFQTLLILVVFGILIPTSIHPSPLEFIYEQLGGPKLHLQYFGTSYAKYSISMLSSSTFHKTLEQTSDKFLAIL